MNEVVFNEDWYSTLQCSNLTTLFDKTRPLVGDIIEIGCWEGKSTSHLANACAPETLICNDTWQGNVAESAITGITHVTELFLKERDVYTQFIKNMNVLTKQNYSIVKKDCIAWLRERKDPIKFIHIDASHEYESVHETIRLALPFMVPGGCMCGDDYINAGKDQLILHGGVERAVAELLPGHKNEGNLWYWFKQ